MDFLKANTGNVKGMMFETSLKLLRVLGVIELDYG